jgi:hypothetical protein
LVRSQVRFMLKPARVVESRVGHYDFHQNWFGVVCDPQPLTHRSPHGESFFWNDAIYVCLDAIGQVHSEYAIAPRFAPEDSFSFRWRNEAIVTSRPSASNRKLS